ncbi:DUF4832 domain-containing protein [Bacteroides sp. OttesenSCG-928-D19]|nr:DUF4832 domain-containing protein [Bacteroides sp. OttesenSCG-928-D19]
MKASILLSFFLALSMLVSCTNEKAKEKTPPGMVSNTFVESNKAFPNPLKGFRGPGTSPYITVDRQYVPWNQIETKTSDGIDLIKAYTDRVFTPFYERGIKIIPRVYLCWPYDTQNESGTRVPMYFDEKTSYADVFWPEDMTVGDYSSPQFQDRAKKMIAKIGQVWNNDDRIAWIEMGLIGYWGEHHSPAPSLEMQKLLAEAFIAAFPNKKVMIRNFHEFTDYPFGFYWDSFAHIEQEYHMNGIIEKDVWRNTVNGGEVAFNWGKVDIQPGTSPDESLSKPEHLNYIIDCVRKVHQNHLGWISEYSVDNPAVASGAEELQKVLGYRFVIDKAMYTGTVTDNKLDIEFHIRNVGSSPLYADYPLEVSLINPDSKQVAWSGIVKAGVSSTWMPGDKWNTETKEYDIPAVANIVKESFNIDKDIPAGTYLLGVTLLDPVKKNTISTFCTR